MQNRNLYEQQFCGLFFNCHGRATTKLKSKSVIQHIMRMLRTKKGPKILCRLLNNVTVESFSVRLGYAQTRRMSNCHHTVSVFRWSDRKFRLLQFTNHNPNNLISLTVGVSVTISIVTTESVHGHHASYVTAKHEQPTRYRKTYSSAMILVTLATCS